MKALSSISIIILFALTTAFAQNAETEKSKFIDISFNYEEMKEQLSYGLVFRGLMPNIKYEYRKNTNSAMYSIKSELGLGLSRARKITALNVKLKPIQFDYCRKIKTAKKNYNIGFFSAINYDYEISPWLHAGHTYWFTAIDIGPAFYFETKIKEIPISVKIKSSLLGFTSRPEYVKEDYFYKLNFKQIVQNLHSDMSFASLNKRFFTQLELSLLNYSKRNWTLAYSFSYSAYYDEPKYTNFTNSLIIRKKIGKTK